VNALKEAGTRVEQVTQALHRWAGPDGTLRVIASHRPDHLLGVFTHEERRWFVKAYDEDSLADMTTEWRAYQQFGKLGVVPRLHHVDPDSRILVTGFIDGGRLSELTGATLRTTLERIPALYGTLTTGPTVAAPPHEKYLSAWNEVQPRSAHLGLPSPAQVLQITSQLPAMTVHGDFQPSNILVDAQRLVAVDFESYGPDIPALDVARLAYNPLLDVDLPERDALAQQMLDDLHTRGTPRTSRRELAACCVLWAVACARYFWQVQRDQPDAEQHSPEARVLATVPLQFASRLWHQEV